MTNDDEFAREVIEGDAASLDGVNGTIARYAMRLTLSPGEVTRSDVEALREAGLDDRAILDCNLIVAYFNFVNRIADGLGVTLEPYWPADER